MSQFLHVLYKNLQQITVAFTSVCQKYFTKGSQIKMFQSLQLVHQRARKILVFFIFCFFCWGVFLFFVQVILRICLQMSILWIDKSVSYFLVCPSIMASCYAVLDDENIKILIFPSIGKNPLLQGCIQLLGLLVSLIFCGIFLQYFFISLGFSWIQAAAQIPYLFCFGVAALSYLCRGLQALQNNRKHTTC